VFLWDFLPCKAVYDIIIYRHVNDFMNVDIKLLNTETKVTNNGHKRDLIEHSELVFHKAAYSN